MSFGKDSGHHDHHREPLSGLVERVTFHSPETGFCVLRVKVRGHRELVSVLGSAASVQPGEFIQCSGRWDIGAHDRADLVAQYMTDGGGVTCVNKIMDFAGKAPE